MKRKFESGLGTRFNSWKNQKRKELQHQPQSKVKLNQSLNQSTRRYWVLSRVPSLFIHFWSTLSRLHQINSKFLAWLRSTDTLNISLTISNTQIHPKSVLGWKLNRQANMRVLFTTLISNINGTSWLNLFRSSNQPIFSIYSWRYYTLHASKKAKTKFKRKKTPWDCAKRESLTKIKIHLDPMLISLYQAQQTSALILSTRLSTNIKRVIIQFALNQATN